MTSHCPSKLSLPFGSTDCGDHAVGGRFKRDERVLLSAVRATIESTCVIGVLAFGGNGGRMAFVGESSRPGTRRRMLAMPISGDFGVPRHSDIETRRCAEFESIDLLVVAAVGRSNCHQKVGILIRRKDS